MSSVHLDPTRRKNQGNKACEASKARFAALVAHKNNFFTINPLNKESPWQAVGY
jgi:hypothetical protein